MVVIIIIIEKLLNNLKAKIIYNNVFAYIIYILCLEQNILIIIIYEKANTLYITKLRLLSSYIAYRTCLNSIFTIAILRGYMIFVENSRFE